MHKYINIPERSKLYIVGDIHEHFIQFNKIVDLISPSKDKFIVFVGDVYDKGYGVKFAESITERIIELQNQGFTFAVKGNHELRLIRKNKKETNKNKYLEWWSKQPSIITFNFYNRNSITVLHAGITPNHTHENIKNDYEVCYVRDIDLDTGKMIPLEWKEIDGKKLLCKVKEGTLWHKIYDGRFGYIVSGHIAQKDGKIRYYNNSCNIDSCVYDTGLLSALEIDYNGRAKSLIQVWAPPFKPELPLGY